MSDRFDVYKAVLEDTGRFQLRFDTTFNVNRALVLTALGTGASGALGLLVVQRAFQRRYLLWRRAYLACCSRGIWSGMRRTASRFYTCAISGL